MNVENAIEQSVPQSASKADSSEALDIKPGLLSMRLALVLLAFGSGLAYIVYFFLMFLGGVRQNSSMADQLAPNFYNTLRGWLNPAWIQVNREDNGIVGQMSAFALMLLAVMLLYGAALYLVRHYQHANLLGFIVVSTALFTLPLMFAPGMNSTDVFSYISYGQMPQVYNVNPFVGVPRGAVSKTLLDQLYWPDESSVYGPAWIDLSRGVTVVAQAINPNMNTNLPLYVLLYKLLEVIAHLVNIFLVYAILSRWKPERRNFGTLLYAWNPLMLLEYANSGHNDVAMVSLMLAGILLYLRGKPMWAVAAFTIGVLMKVTLLIIFAPFGLLLLWQVPTLRARVIRFAQVTGLFILISVVLYTPYWEGIASFHTLLGSNQVKRMINSPGQMFYLEWLRLDMHTLEAQNPKYNQFYYDQVKRWPIYPDDPIDKDVKLIAVCLMAVATLWNLWRVRNFDSFLRSSSWLVFFYLLFVALWFWPWYVGPLVALVALRPPDALTVLATVFSCTSLFLWVVWSDVPASLLWLLDYRAAFMFAPALIIAVICYTPRRYVVQRAHPSSHLADQEATSLCWSTVNAAAKLIQVNRLTACSSGSNR